MLLRGREQRNLRFAELREDFLLNYGYQTARAYWSDLEDIMEWAKYHGLDVMALSEQQFAEYLGALRKLGYAASTVRRRQSTWRQFARRLAAPRTGAANATRRALRPA